MRFSFVGRYGDCWARCFTRRRLNPEPLGDKNGRFL